MKNLQAGITLVELVVIVSIVTLVSVVLLFNYSNFSTNVSTRTLAQEIGIAIRKVQTYATSVQGIAGTSGGTGVGDGSGVAVGIDPVDTGGETVSTTRFPAYGISFSVGQYIDQTIPSEKGFVIFADIPSRGDTSGNNLYEMNGRCGSPSEGAECLEAFNILSADKIIELCTDVTGCTRDYAINVVFKRPSPDATICIVRDNACLTPVPSYLQVKVQSVQGYTKIISVWNTGQISIE